MRYLTFTDQDRSDYPICFLVPTIQKDEIQRAYLDGYAIPPEDVLVMTLHYGPGKKTPMAEMKAYIAEELVPVFDQVGVEYIIVTDGEYFKALTKAVKVDAHLGYVMDCAFGPQKVIYVPSHRQIFYDPIKVKAKIAQGLTSMISHRNGTYTDPGNGIIHFAEYPQSYQEIEAWLEKLLAMDCPLAIDIETFSLKHHTAGIGTITFAWSQHEGIAFAVDYEPIPNAIEAPFGRQVRNEPVHRLLRSFFGRFMAKAMYHSISFDVYVLIYQLFMSDILDTKGLLQGIKVMLRNWDCTKLITYLATNSCAGNKLGLKDQAQEFSGNWSMGESITDITRIPLAQLLQYNLVDGISTWFVKEKHWDRLVADAQLDIYDNLFKPATLDIVQMQLTGLPVNMDRVKEVKGLLQTDETAALKTMAKSPVVQQFTYRLQEKHVRDRNAKLKTKRIGMSDQETLDVTFNPNSGPQLQALLFDMLGLPVLSLTDSKQPSTDGDTLKALKKHTDDPQVIEFLSGLIDYKDVNKLLTSFIPAFENAALGPDGWHYLFGNFNLGGTLSGRLSSSDPNLQNLPANSRYAKLIKSCVQAPPGWLFVGLDFSSLEDRISALTTKDPNKIKVYTDGYDGHSLRAYFYFTDEMPDIDPNSVVSINSIEKKYKPLRQGSKVPTFALTYMGTINTLMTGSGFSREMAKKIYDSYHELYKVSTACIATKLDQAAKDGYVTAAFGLRVRTPLLSQVIRGTRKTPYEAEAEGRSAGNALGQSWCLLNSRAGVEFNRKVRASEYALDIRPCAQIHDAQYFLLRDDIDAVLYTNEHLVKAVQWQDHDEIRHDEVKLGGELSIFYPNWQKEIGIPNGASLNQIYDIIATAIN